MRVGDLIQYSNPNVERNTGIAIRIYEPAVGWPNREMVDILWDDGDIIVHDTDEFEVISESR